MTAYIGNLSFIRMEGPQMPALQRDIRPFERPCADGWGFYEDVLKAPEIQLFTTEWCTTLAAANASADVYAAYKGYPARTVIDDFGRTVYGVLVLDVRVTAVRPLLVSVPAGYYYQVEAVWRLKPTR